MVKTEMKVLLYLKRNSQDRNGDCPLMGKITVKGETNSTVQFGCKIKVNPKIWNATSQRCSGKSKASVSTNKEIEKVTIYDNTLNSVTAKPFSFPERFRQDLGYFRCITVGVTVGVADGGYYFISSIFLCISSINRIYIFDKMVKT